MKAVGTKTAHKTSAVAIIGPVTSLMAFLVASNGESPNSIFLSTFSTTTIASSTTITIASTRPKSESALMLNPNPSMTANVPTSETGTATNGITEARHV